MSVKVSTLSDAKPSLLIDAGDAWDGLSEKFGGHVKDCGKYLRQRLGEKWSGGLGAESAADRLGRMQYDLVVAKKELDAVGTVLRAAGEVFFAHQGRLKNLVTEAREAGFTVHEDGGISGPDVAKGLSGADAGAAKKAQAERMKGFAEGISQVLRDAQEADKQYTAAIKVFTDAANRCAKGDWSVGILDLNTAETLDQKVLSEIGMPDKKASPAAVHSWWQGLPPGLRKELLEDHPVILGNRDGIPAADRDMANRDYLPTLLNHLQAEHERSSGDRQDELKSKIDGLKGIQKQLMTGGEPRPYLLGMGDEGNGRAIVAFGNPDTAKNVSAYVPGLNTKLSDHFASADVGRARDVAQTAERYGGRGSTSSIVWLGYDAPQLDGVNSGMLDVAFKDNAQQGAPAYNQFLHGVRATHEGAAPHVTALGHSYGSLTVGQASQQPGGVPADDIILVGSPGTGVNKASDLGVGADHVYVGAAENDQVTYLPPSLDNWQDYFDVIAPGGEFGPRKIAFGVDPASSDFGGHHFKVEPGKDTGLSGLVAGDLPAHSLYFDPEKGSESLKNIAKVVTGHGRDITPVDPR
ncbi:alpha/beta hydrolase [Streptomyces netropsis]